MFIRRIQKKGESKLIPKWQGPYRIIGQKNPGVYKLKDLQTNKVIEQHIENIREKVVMARESEIPLAECPKARLPFPTQEEQENGRTPKQIPEGAPDNNWFDDTFWLNTNVEELTEANQLPRREKTEEGKDIVIRRVSPRRKQDLGA